MKNLIIFYPSFERGGAEKILINLIDYLSKKNINIYLIINKKIIKKKNVKYIEIIKNNKFVKSRLVSSFLGSIKLLKLLLNMDRKTTKILSMQSNFFSVLVSFFLRFKIAIRISEDPCGANKYSDEKFFSNLIFISKLITYNLSDSIIVNAKKSYECTQKICINKKKIKILYNPSLKKLYPFKIKKNNKLILNIGRVCKQKNQNYLVNNFIKFHKRNTNYKLLICGDGPEFQTLRNNINKSKSRKNIIIKPWTSDPKKIYNKASAFVLTSLYEGMPNVLIEAINHNIPVISSNVSGVSDLLLNGKGGEIFDLNKEGDLLSKFELLNKKFENYVNKTRIAKKKLYRFEYNFACLEYYKFLKNKLN